MKILTTHWLAGIAIIVVTVAGCTGASGNTDVSTTPPPPTCGRMMQSADGGGCAPLPVTEVKRDEVRFSSLETPGGKVELIGTITRPVFGPDAEAPAKRPGVVLIGGSGPHSRAGSVPGDLTGPFAAPVNVLEDLANGLTEAGYVVLRYDKRSCAGEVIKDCTYTLEQAKKTTWEDLVGDIKAAAAFLATQPDVDLGDIILVGHSQGATLALEAAPEIKGLSEVVLLAGTFYPIDTVLVRQINWQMSAFGEQMTEAQKEAANQQLATVESAVLAIKEGYMPPDQMFLGAPPPFWKAWIDASTRTPEAVVALGKPVLYLRGGEDQNASAEDQSGFAKTLGGKPQTRVTDIPGHTHALTRSGVPGGVSKDAIKAVIDWLGRP